MTTPSGSARASSPRSTLTTMTKTVRNCGSPWGRPGPQYLLLSAAHVRVSRAYEARRGLQL